MGLLPFIHFFCFILYSYLAIFILTRSLKSPLNRLCFAILMCFALWSFGGTFIHIPAISKSSARVFENISCPGWVSFSSFFLWGALIFIGKGTSFLPIKNRRLRFIFFYTVLFLPPLVLIYKQWTNFMVVDYTLQSYGWALVWSTSYWFYLYCIYMFLFSGTALFLFFLSWKKPGNPAKKRQARVFFLTILATFITGFFTDILLPWFHLYLIPDIADIIALIAAYGLVYAMVKYKFLTITPATAAENIIATMSDSLILLDASGNIVKINRATSDLLGYREEELKDKSVEIFMEVNDENRKNILIEEMCMGKEIAGYELSLKSSQDKEIPVIFSCSALKDEYGTVMGMVCISRDITRRKREEEELEEHRKHLEKLVGVRTAKLEEINLQLQKEIDERKIVEETLRKSKEKYKTLTENINVGIYRHTAENEGKFIEANPAAVGMFGFDNKEEFLATTVSQHFNNPEDMKRFNRDLFTYGYVKDENLKFKKKDGTLFTGSISAAAVRDSRGKMIYYDGIIEDITARKRLEEQLMQARKMEALGQLTGGIAHEFNNILTSVIGYTELSQIDLPSESPLNDYLSKVLKTASHAKALIRQLLTFSRKAVIHPEIIDLNRVFREFQTLIRKALGEDVVMDFIPGEKLERVKADPGQIEQIIINLAANSRDAMPTGGKLTIATENIEVDHTMIRRYPYMKPGFYVRLSVSDTGCGMTREELSHIFEPFFTTKKKTRGTGLGLSTVYGIVKQNNGYININSKPGLGTRIDIYLPQADEEEKIVKQHPREVKLHPGKETILVVEDEETVRDIADKILSACGYHIILAGSGEDAFDLWEKNKERVDLLLTDIVLPGINGWQLARKILDLKPDLKVLYMSGYSHEAIAQHGALGKDVPFIRKPFTSATLTRKINEVLES